ncbi:hypothetical protein HPC62_02115 [Thermoleptolyngbya sichuanensis A183]|uniref:DUF1795 domain-containing protein n=1 Tax=Thermoleptolyngbya sichuanensis A183 TaxID=2737172 RepID=A0A6M8B275_9CYAN|nr:MULTISPECIES: hypothetical protein [Thermoleptolyngbya]QKD81129.1 hypothetical protein HPC62_02115 [Thermoleptolyngbya sichuanensis A183]
MMNPNPQSSARLALHRFSLGLLVVAAVSCQVQSPPVPPPGGTGTPTGQPSPISAAPESGLYRSDRFGFQFAYPADQFVAHGETEFPPEVVAREAVQIWTIDHDRAIQAGEYEGGTEYPANVSVTVQPNPEGLSATDWIAQSDWFTDVREVQEVTVAGQQAIAFRSSGLYDMEQVLVPTPDGKNWVLITLNQVGTGESDAQYRQAYDRAIATLRFMP